MFPQVDVVFVVHDTGLLTGFFWNTATWEPEAGVFDTLTETQDGWLLTHKDGSTRAFDEYGRIESEADASGNLVCMSYETVGGTTRLDHVTDAAGRQLDFGYDQSGWLSTITPPPYGQTQRVWTLVGDSTDGLSSIFDPMNFETAFVYDTAGRIRRIIDPNGNSALVTYTDGFVSKVDDPEPFDDQDQRFAYDEGDEFTFTRTCTDRRGKEWVYEFDTNWDDLISMTDPLTHTVSWLWAEGTHTRSVASRTPAFPPSARRLRQNSRLRPQPGRMTMRAECSPPPAVLPRT